MFTKSGNIFHAAMIEEALDKVAINPTIRRASRFDPIRSTSM